MLLPDIQRSLTVMVGVLPQVCVHEDGTLWRLGAGSFGTVSILNDAIGSAIAMHSHARPLLAKQCLKLAAKTAYTQSGLGNTPWHLLMSRYLHMPGVQGAAGRGAAGGGEGHPL